MGELRPDDFTAFEATLREALSARAHTVSPATLNVAKMEALREALTMPHGAGGSGSTGSSGSSGGSGGSGGIGAGGSVSTWAAGGLVLTAAASAAFGLVYMGKDSARYETRTAASQTSAAGSQDAPPTSGAPSATQPPGAASSEAPNSYSASVA